MNRNDVIRMAREAGFESHDISLNFPKELERFAALVQDDFRCRLANAIEAMPFGDTAASFAAFVRGFE